MGRRHKYRILAAVVVGLLLLPALVPAVSSSPDPQSSFGGRDDILFVTAQGGALGDVNAKAIAVDTQSGQIIWKHTKYKRYFDIDPINESTVLIVASEQSNGAEMYAQLVNWKTGEEYNRFQVPFDTHDVDRLSEGNYVVADKENHRIYTYNTTTATVTWEYSYPDNYPPDAGGDGGDYTHLNDVDPVNNGSAFLASPRNFDRVMLINRSTKEVEWTLGEEDNYSILHEQHNPNLLDSRTPTILVADSENNRIVEYSKQDDAWTKQWEYSGNLRWPRDADRLPNNNTLIVDSAGQRVLEVTPRGDVVWSITVAKAPYDAELLSLGEEPSHEPLINKSVDDSNAAQGQKSSRIGYVYQLSQWLFPWATTVTQFVSFSLGIVVLSVWTSTEALLFSRSTGRSLPTVTQDSAQLGAGALSILFGIIVALQPVSQPYIAPLKTQVAVLLSVLGVSIAWSTVCDIAGISAASPVRLVSALAGVMGSLYSIHIALQSSQLTTLRVGLAASMMLVTGRSVSYRPILPDRYATISTTLTYWVTGLCGVVAASVVFWQAASPRTLDLVYGGAGVMLLTLAISRGYTDAVAFDIGEVNQPLETLLGGVRGLAMVLGIGVSGFLLSLTQTPTAFAPIYAGLAIVSVASVLYSTLLSS